MSGSNFISGIIIAGLGFAGIALPEGAAESVSNLYMGANILGMIGVIFATINVVVASRNRPRLHVRASDDSEPSNRQLCYLISSIFFILGVRLTHPRTAVGGNRLAGMGMLMAIAVTLGRPE